ncbi:MAG TPA: histidinol phosphate phosphatase domain-containing protein [Dehalococcoidia bacterium]|nr:histidinol phosphate phosphatase domain-containing protein [Dehalococcoidia bacterium]
MIYDFHTHSSLSDGDLSPVELVRRASVLGYTGMAITDHAGLGALERFAYELEADCRLAREMWEVDVYPGVELTHVPAQSVDECARKAKEAGAAVVVVHGETVVEPVEPGTNLAAIQSSYVDVLGHPGLITFEEARLAAEKGVFLELSARRTHCVANGHVARVAREAGAKLILDSDQHDLDFLTPERQRYVALGAGLSEDDLEDVLFNNPRELLSRIKERLQTGVRT